MKRILKNNIVVLVVLAITVFIILLSINQQIKELEISSRNMESIVEQCKIDISNGIEDANKLQVCEEIIKNENIEIDFYTVFSDFLVFRIHYFNAIAFLIIVIPSLYSICKILKNKFIINSLLRESYIVFLKKFFLEAYKYIWILPVITIFMMTIIALNTTFDPTYAITNNTVVWSESLINNPIKFIFLYLLNIVFYSFTFVNIALIVAKKQHKFVPCVILSYILYIGLELFLEIVVTMLISNIIFKSDFGIIFNIMNLFMFNDVFGVGTLLGFSLLVMIISFIFVFLTYKNKEKLIIQCEKNN